VVVPGGQGIHVGTQGLRVGRLQCPAARDALWIIPLDSRRLQVGVEGHLGVDGDRAPAGETHHGVRPRPVRQHLLGAEVDVPKHAGGLEDALQLHLTPLATRRGGAEGRGERRRRPPQLLVAGARMGELGGQRRELLDPLPFEERDLLAHVGERGLHGREGAQDVGVAGGPLPQVRGLLLEALGPGKCSSELGAGPLPEEGGGQVAQHGAEEEGEERDQEVHGHQPATCH